MNAPPHVRSWWIGDTWLEPEELTYPSGGFHRRALVRLRANSNNTVDPSYPVGLLRVVRCSVPDTYSTIPARLRLGSRTIIGYVSIHRDGTCFQFTPECNHDML